MANDYFVRVSYADLQQIRLVHLLSGFDEDVPESPHQFDGAMTITGYTEWVSDASPVITLGWDWQIVAKIMSAGVSRIGEPRSNLMLVDQRGIDIGPDKTGLLLEMFVDGMDWSDSVLRYIEERYDRKLGGITATGLNQSQ